MRNKKIIIILISMFILITLVSCNDTGDNIITEEKLKSELEKLDSLNKNSESINQENYPKTIGKHWKNNLELEEVYFCSDVCPVYGAVSLVYKGIESEEECAIIGGRDLIDAAWGGYIGCKPYLEGEKILSREEPFTVYGTLLDYKKNNERVMVNIKQEYYNCIKNESVIVIYSKINNATSYITPHFFLNLQLEEFVKGEKYFFTFYKIYENDDWILTVPKNYIGVVDLPNAEEFLKYKCNLQKI